MIRTHRLFTMMAIALTLVSCTSVYIKDQAWFVDKGILGAVEIHTLKNGIKEIPRAEWDEQRFGMLCITRDTFAEIKKEYEKLCSRTKCNYEQQMIFERILQQINDMELKYNESLH